MNLADTIRSTLVPIHREGYPFIAGFTVGTLVLGLVWGPLFWIGLILTDWWRLLPNGENLDGICLTILHEAKARMLDD